MDNPTEILFSRSAGSGKWSVQLNGSVRDLYCGLAYIFDSMIERGILDELTLMAIWVSSLSLSESD